MPSRISALLSLAVVALSSNGAAAHADPAPAYERHAVTAVNDVRSDHGLRVLRRADCLSRFADRHARRMAQRQVLFHQDLNTVTRRCGLRLAAENVAVGYRTGRTTVHDGWMTSPGHRANILTRAHRVTAVGASRDEHGLWWTVQILGSR